VPFNTTPAMKAPEITAAGIEALRSKRYDVVRVNYANPDMVGHTGDLEATRKACEVVDAQVGMLLQAVEEMGGVFLLTADHGNADDMVQREKKTNKPVMQDGKIATLTSHTLAPVPVAIGGPGLPASVRFRDDLPEAGLANITGTYLNLMGYQAPSNMEASLLATA
jgi:2,3-bisphosphoglycerate-independent phosphoglycerate mutase